MTIRSPHRQLTRRDLALQEAVDRHPFTTDQLFRLSVTFAEQFTQERLPRRRLQQLRETGLLQSWTLATVGRGGAPHYWKLTRTGYQWLQGDEIPLPSRRFFEAIAPGHHHHTRCLGDFLVQTLVAAHRQGIAVRHFARENSVTLEANGFLVVPDCAFQLHTPDGRVFHYCVELDNGTERVRSRLDVESIERKLRGYDAHQSQFAALDPGVCDPPVPDAHFATNTASGRSHSPEVRSTISLPRTASPLSHARHASASVATAVVAVAAANNQPFRS